MDSGDIARLYGNKETRHPCTHTTRLKQEAYDSVRRHCFLHVNDIFNMVVIKSEALGEPI